MKEDLGKCFGLPVLMGGVYEVAVRRRLGGTWESPETISLESYFISINTRSIDPHGFPVKGLFYRGKQKEGPMWKKLSPKLWKN